MDNTTIEDSIPKILIPIDEKETVIEVSSNPDGHNRQHFYALWIGKDYLRYNKVRGQGFFTDLTEFIKKEEEKGRTVRIINRIRL